jgi:hypothetical protein
MNLRAIRTLRTPYSERHIIASNDKEIAAVDLHYLLDGRVAGTLTVFDGCGVAEKEITMLLAFIDNELLPEVSIGEHNLSFTVVIGRVIGNFSHAMTDDAKT